MERAGAQSLWAEENQSTEEESEINDEVTNDLNDSIDSGEYLTDEPKNEDYENSYESDYLSNSFKNNVSNNETLDPGSIAEQTISEKISLKSILKNQEEIEFTNEKDKKNL